MNIGIYAGSFDPFTLGHLHVVKQAVELFDKVIIVIANNPNKSRRTNHFGMQKAIMETIKNENIDNISIDITNGLISNYAKSINANYLIRGLRNGTDFDYEENVAKINEELNHDLKTIYFRAGDKSHISSSAVTQILNMGGDISNWVSEPIKKYLK